MGCISSKVVMARSSSHSGDDHRHNHHHATPLINHLLIATATPANHHLQALLSPSNTILPKSQPTLSALHLAHSLTDLGDTRHTIDALELKAGLDPDPSSPQHDILAAGEDVDANSKEYSRRSKSCQWSHKENKATMERCTSFHTVEEYDALLQRILMSSSSLPEPVAKDDGELLGVPDTNFNQVTTDSAAKKDSDEMKSMATVRRDDERGIKRKKTGEGLAGSLHMGNIEFQTVGSLRQWLDIHVYSPGGGDGDAATDFVTPQFGSYYNNNNNTQAPGEDSVLFETGKQQEKESIIEVDPELVAAFEEYMQQLQVEEDNILKQIEANLHIQESPTTQDGHA